MEVGKRCCDEVGALDFAGTRFHAISSVGINGRLLQSADGSEQECNFYGG